MTLRGGRLGRSGVVTLRTGSLFVGVVGLAGTVLARRKRGTTEAIAHEMALRKRTEAHLATVVDSSSDAIISLTPTGVILTWNTGAQEMLGYRADEMVGQAMERIVSAAGAAEQAEWSERARDGGSAGSFEGIGTRKDGTTLPVAVTLSPVRLDGTVVAISAVLRDISTTRDLAEALDRRAFYDGLTELPNRILLEDRLRHGLERAARSGLPPGVILLDIDNFKAINNSLGHGIGDKVLLEVGCRLQAVVRPMDTVARIGADEFVVLVEDPQPGAVIRAAQRVLETLKLPIHLEGHSVLVRASAGVAVGEVGQGSDELLGNADAAMYTAKAAGKGHWQVFAPEMHQALLQRVELTADLAGAIDRDELFVVYQPIVDLSSRRIVGAEALVRWGHPVRGLVSPVDFISIAEDSGQIVDLGGFVLRQALHQLSRCQRDDPSFYLTVNFSPIQFRRPDFVQMVLTALAEADVDPARLVLEVTETGLMTDLEKNTATLAELRSSGLRIAIDDFGTGYSSISYLKCLPVDIVKIDKSLVDGLATEPGVWALVQAIFGLIAAVGLDTVAEGIEASAQVAHLEVLGCTRGQGYYFARPLPGTKLDELVAGCATLPQPSAPAADPVR